MRILTGIKNLCDLINGFHHGKFVVIGIARGSWGITSCLQYETIWDLSIRRKIPSIVLTTEPDFIFVKNLLTLKDVGYVDEEDDEYLKLKIKQYVKSRKLLEDVENAKVSPLWISCFDNAKSMENIIKENKIRLIFCDKPSFCKENVSPLKKLASINDSSIIVFTTRSKSISLPWPVDGILFEKEIQAAFDYIFAEFRYKNNGDWGPPQLLRKK